ncbi:MAG: type II toxin-antitoxin system RelE/ParE family toxin [Proteobacteria bacterium]|nr:type II toxin-antitoxin system RelE/ParE family toxin [Pseudomonadota bacterium]
MKLKWSVKALIDFDEAQNWIAHENPIAARAVARRIRDATQLLRANPHAGTPTHIEDTRSWVVARTPYLIVYRVRGETLEILRLWHGRRDWKNTVD